VLTVAAGGDRSEAEDVVHEAFVRLVPRWKAVREYDDPEAWVRAVAFRLLSNGFRRARNQAKALVRLQRPAVLAGPGPDSLDLGAAVATLPLGQRQVVVLHYLLELSVREVAHELQIAEGTVKSRLARAREALGPLVMDEVVDNV
jgi:RNA polymerase sigma-70 factor (ECF subfamily)